MELAPQNKLESRHTDRAVVCRCCCLWLLAHVLLLTETRYSNLCALCEHPEVCDYPDIYSGYEGALRCLVENGGQIAWTKVYYVKKHFGV